MTDFTNTTITAEEDPQMVLTFKAEDGEEVKLTVTVSVEGDIRKTWPELVGFEEREAVHVAADWLFQDISRDMR